MNDPPTRARSPGLAIRRNATDIVDSTSRAAQLGDRRWTALLDEHNAVIRRELARAYGREIKRARATGSWPRFDGPPRAVRWAATARDAAKRLGIDLRAGIHTGECERKNDDLAGIAVHIGARIGALASPASCSSHVNERSRGSRPPRTDSLPAFHARSIKSRTAATFASALIG